MPENIPSVPGGALPPKPAEAAKVQPKKETVRINLPPKPTSAPTIKLPTLAPGGPSSSAGTAAPVAPSAAPAASAAARAAAPAAAPLSRASATTAARPPAPAAPAGRPAVGYVAPAAGVRTLDKVLAIVAMVVVLAAVGSCLYLVLGGVDGLQPLQQP
ncbi:MAG TPA: hypothetical protein VN765_15185 [Candidatus Acidoferrum sp.]|nr:hypothetical protein [Candidatus Acidoferrum sp.]